MALRRIVWTQSAQEDLSEIKDFIGFPSSPATVKFIQKLVSRPKFIQDFPAMGSRVPELPERSEHRQVIVGRYRLIYRIENELLLVIRILHSARDFWTAWEAKIVN